MKKKTITRRIFLTAFLFLLYGVGLCMGNYQGYSRGYHDGQKVTNSWWIDKQSRYYDSAEVEKKRRSQKYDLL